MDLNVIILGGVCIYLLELVQIWRMLAISVCQTAYYFRLDGEVKELALRRVIKTLLHLRLFDFKDFLGLGPW